MSNVNICTVTRLKQIRNNILDEILRISVIPVSNNYTYSIEGQSVTNGVDTNPDNMAKLFKDLAEIEKLLEIYDPFEIHTVMGEP